MPKLQNVTDAELQEAMDKADDLIADLQDLSNRIEKGYADKIGTPMRYGSTMRVLAMSALDAQGKIFMHTAMEEQKAELQRLMEQRAAAL